MELMDPDVGKDALPERGSRLRILHLLAPARFGGLESVVEALATEQARAGHDVHVAAILDEGVTDHPLISNLAARGVQTYAFHVAARAYLRERALVEQVCRTSGADVLHTHGYRPDVLHWSVARRLGVATVSTSHGFLAGSWKNRVYEFLQRRAFRKMDAVVAVSRPMAASLREAGIPEHRLHLIPNAWADATEFLERAEARRVLRIDGTAFTIGFVGRMGPEKGPDVFLEAFARLQGARAVLIGDGRLRDGLMARAESLGLSGALTWTGALQDAGTLMKAFDVLVLSSRTEGTPVVLLEAMAAGIPVVATRVGGVPDVVSGAEALLVDSDDPAALALAIRQVMDEPVDAARRAQAAARRLASDFGAERWLACYERVYRSCTAHRAAAAAPERSV